MPIYFAVQRDAALRREQAMRLVRERPGTILEQVSGTGHSIQFDRPAVMTSLIRRAADESASIALPKETP